MTSKRRLSKSKKDEIIEQHPKHPSLRKLLDLVWLSKGCWFIREDWSEYATFNNERAHRYSFRIFNPTKIIDELLICHKCDRRGCINPDHLFIGTHSNNMQDMRRKNRTTIILNHRFRGLDKLRREENENKLLGIDHVYWNRIRSRLSRRTK